MWQLCPVQHSAPTSRPCRTRSAAVKIDGASHEFCAIDGVREDVTEIILNVKNVIFTINADKNESGDFGNQDQLFEVTLNASLPSIEAQKKSGVEDENLEYSKVITASEINTASLEDIKVVNGDTPICTLAAGGSINMVLLIRNGVGYVSTNEN